jgi:ATP-dependent DNA helicase RecG
MANLETSIQFFAGIGPKYAAKLETLGIESIRDFIYYLPSRYDDLSKIEEIGSLKIDQISTIQGKIIDAKSIRTFRKRMSITEALIEDSSGAIRATWFNQPYLEDYLKKGKEIRLSGKVTQDSKGIYFSNPVHELASRTPTNTGRIVPVYPETYGITSRWIRWKMQEALKSSLAQIEDLIPLAIAKRQKLISAKEALRQIHFPDSFEIVEEARKRIAFEEMFLIQLNSIKSRKDWETSKAISINLDEKLIQDFVKSLPFTLTNAQRKSSFQILKDVERNYPMNRLLEGDVGSGKTVVAAIAALEAMMAGYQTAILAPTEVLAKQHFETFGKVLKGFSQKVGLLTASESRTFWKKNTRKNFLGKIRRGEIRILIGTHALIQKDVEFKNLALVVIDEQHRFGVAQRAHLQKQASQLKDGLAKYVPHLLTMTATPIPRTLALAFFGNLDISLLDELPKGRKKIITEIIAPGNQKKVYDLIQKEISKGRQAFFIYPLIDESEKIEGKAATKEHENLSKNIFPKLKIGLLHGRLKSKDKEEIMRDFKDKKYDILVSTSVIEVGVDVPNATIMVIEGSERFGLSQLHQFRGRVGRSDYQSHCFLFTGSSSATTNRRLKALTESEDGFKLAEKDLEIRGPGQFIGVRQSGRPDTAMQYLHDVKLIQQARIEAQSLFEFDPKLEKFPALKQALDKFDKEVHLE